MPRCPGDAAVLDGVADVRAAVPKRKRQSARCGRNEGVLLAGHVQLELGLGVGDQLAAEVDGDCVDASR